MARWRLPWVGSTVPVKRKTPEHPQKWAKLILNSCVYIAADTNNNEADIRKCYAYVKSFRSSLTYVGIHLTDDLTWTVNTQHTLKKSRQRLYFLRQLRKFRASVPISCVSWQHHHLVWELYSLRLQCRIIRAPLPILQETYKRRLRTRAQSIVK